MKSSRNFPSLASRPLHPKELKKIYRILRASFGHQAWWPGQTPFEVMVGAVLTQNTAWINVERAILNLKKAGKLAPRAIEKMSHRQLAKLITPAGYFNVKARRLKAFVRFYLQEYGGSVRRMKREKTVKLRAKLLGVSGVGPETADSILVYAVGRTSFVIDAYTKRIFARHGMETPDEPYERWRSIFEQSLPKSLALYNDFHAQIVHLGKTFCRSTRPRCDVCPLKPYL